MLERSGTVAEIEAITRQLTAAQRRAVLDAEPDSGENRTVGRRARRTDGNHRAQAMLDAGVRRAAVLRHIWESDPPTHAD